MLYTDPSGHCIVGALLGLFNINYACPGAPPSAPYINVREKEKGVDIGDIDRPLPPDAKPGWITDPKDVPQDPGGEIYVPLPDDDAQEGYDRAPNGNSLNILAETDGDEADDEDEDLRFDEDQDALIQLAKDAKNRGDLTIEEAEILFEWANEYGLDSHQNKIETHPNRNFDIPHIHIGPVDHIPVAI